MKFIIIHGGNRSTPGIARRSGWLYGVRSDHKAYAPPYMIDYHSGKTSWAKTLELAKVHQPAQVVLGDMDNPVTQRPVFEIRMNALLALGITPVIVAKHPDAFRPDWPVIWGVSVPTGYFPGGYMPLDELTPGSRIHLLGGWPDQWLYLRRLYRSRGIVVNSLDGNSLIRVAQFGDFWSRYGFRKTAPKNRFSTAAIAALSFKNAARYTLSDCVPSTTKRVLACKRDLGLLPRQLVLL